LYLINFVCPWCGKKAEVWEEESCPVSNSVDSFEVTCWEEDENGNQIHAEEVEADWGPRKVHEPDFSEPQWLCSSCLNEISPDIQRHTDLFNWLRERGMLEEIDTATPGELEQ
jgi:hypothetical protein